MAVVLTGCSLFDNQRSLTLDALVSSDFDGTDITSNPQETTTETCVGDIDCVEAYSTDQADYLRFDSRDAAEAYAETLEDGFVVNYIVMDFAGKDAVSTEEQRWAMESLSGTWQEYEGEFPNR